MNRTERIEKGYEYFKAIKAKIRTKSEYFRPLF